MLVSKSFFAPGGQVQRIDLQEVERLVRHLEASLPQRSMSCYSLSKQVDRGELAKRCQRLAEENQDHPY